MPNEPQVKAKVAGRDAADELADLYISQAADLVRSHGEYGQDAAIEFFERLRDNLIAIRPLPVVDAKPVEAKKPVGRLREEDAIDWDQCDLPDRFVLVEFNEYVRQETDKAVLIGRDKWVPKGQMYEVPNVGDYIGEWPVTRWIADKDGWEYRD